MKLVSGLIALAIVSCSFSCGTGRKHKHPTSSSVPLPTPTKFFIHGDPNELIEGTTSDSSGLIEVEDISNLEGFQLAAFVEFVQKTNEYLVTPLDGRKDVEEENDTSQAVEIPDSNYSFSKEGSFYNFRDRASKTPGLWPSLTFKEKDGKLVFVSSPFVTDFEDGPIHYSVRSDGQAFSILIPQDDYGLGNDGKKLTAFYFVKVKDKVPVRRVDSDLNYFIMGDGVAMPRKKPIKIDVCGKDALSHKNEVEHALQRWSDAGGEKFGKGYIGKQPYSVEVKTDARPFSDLNQNCVNFIDEYRDEDQPAFAVLGTTITIVDWFNQEILNSQIFIFNRALSKKSKDVDYVLTHEMGHALGLGHRFRAFKAFEPMSSIMSYDGTEDLTWADQETIKNLYLDDQEPCRPKWDKDLNCEYSTTKP